MSEKRVHAVNPEPAARAGSRDTIPARPTLLDVSSCERLPCRAGGSLLARQGRGGKMRVAGRAAVPMRDHPPRLDTSGAQSGLARLLLRLAADADEAASAYQRLRLTLERFFDWQGVWSPEECADETLDRLARKLEGTLEIEDVRRYALGIARLVLHEWRRRPTAVSLDERTDVAAAAPEADEDDGLRRCFDRCLDALPEESRALVLDYYVAERRAKIDNRRRLAQSFGVSENALRSRVQRVRDRLERCVESCTAAASDPRLARGDVPLDRRRSADV